MCLVRSRAIDEIRGRERDGIVAGRLVPIGIHIHRTPSQRPFERARRVVGADRKQAEPRHEEHRGGKDNECDDDAGEEGLQVSPRGSGCVSRRRALVHCSEIHCAERWRVTTNQLVLRISRTPYPRWRRKSVRRVTPSA
jgi:hypothetical protein